MSEELDQVRALLLSKMRFPVPSKLWSAEDEEGRFATYRLLDWALERVCVRCPEVGVEPICAVRQVVGAALDGRTIMARSVDPFIHAELRDVAVGGVGQPNNVIAACAARAVYFKETAPNFAAQNLRHALTNIARVLALEPGPDGEALFVNDLRYTEELARMGEYLCTLLRGGHEGGAEGNRC